VVTLTSVDWPLLGMIDASAYAPLDGVAVLLDDVLVDVEVLVLVLDVVEDVVDVEELLGGPITVATGAHQPANASPQVTAALPVPVDLL
jgi:hypothetical protein